MSGVDVVIVAVITGLVKVVNSLGVPKKYSPIIALVLGVLGGVFYLHPGHLLDGILYGAVLGLSSVGLYSGTKNLIEAKKAA